MGGWPDSSRICDRPAGQLWPQLHRRITATAPGESLGVAVLDSLPASGADMRQLFEALGECGHGTTNPAAGGCPPVCWTVDGHSVPALLAVLVLGEAEELGKGACDTALVFPNEMLQLAWIEEDCAA